MADAFDLLFVHQLGHALLQGLLVHLVGELIHDDGLALAPVDVFKVHLGAHHHTAAAGAVGFLDTIDAVDDAGGGEVGRGHDFHQVVHAGFRIAQQVQAGVHHLVEVVRRNIGGHAHGNTGRAVHQQIGQAGGQGQRLAFGAVVVGAEINSFLVDVAQHFVCDLGEADFRVAHGSGAVAVHRSEVALAIDQHVAQGKILGHTHDGVVHGAVAVGVIFTNHVPDDTRRFFVGAVPVVIELVHGIEHTTMHGLQAIARIRECAAHDHAHRVIEVTAAHLFF